MVKNVELFSRLFPTQFLLVHAHINSSIDTVKDRGVLVLAIVFSGYFSSLPQNIHVFVLSKTFLE